MGELLKLDDYRGDGDNRQAGAKSARPSPERQPYGPSAVAERQTYDQEEFVKSQGLLAIEHFGELGFTDKQQNFLARHLTEEGSVAWTRNIRLAIASRYHGEVLVKSMRGFIGQKEEPTIAKAAYSWLAAQAVAAVIPRFRHSDSIMTDIATYELWVPRVEDLCLGLNGNTKAKLQRLAFDPSKFYRLTEPESYSYGVSLHELHRILVEDVGILPAEAAVVVSEVLRLNKIKLFENVNKFDIELAPQSLGRALPMMERGRIKGFTNHCFANRGLQDF